MSINTFLRGFKMRDEVICLTSEVPNYAGSFTEILYKIRKRLLTTVYADGFSIFGHQSLLGSSFMLVEFFSRIEQFETRETREHSCYIRARYLTYNVCIRLIGLDSLSLSGIRV